MHLRQLWERIRRQKSNRTTVTDTVRCSDTQVQLLAEPRALSTAELASMESTYNPEISGKTKADFFMDTGMTPEMYLLRLLDAHGGKLTQARLVAKTGWPTDAISHLLTELEEAGYITSSQSNDSLLITPPEDDN